MPANQASSKGRGRPKGSKNRTSAAPVTELDSSNPFDSSDDQVSEAEPRATRAVIVEDSPEPERTIPLDLLTRVLHEFFTKDATRISRDANAAVGKYVDVFVREAIARAAVEKRGGFLEVGLYGAACGSTADAGGWFRLRTWRRLHRSFCWTCESGTPIMLLGEKERCLASISRLEALPPPKFYEYGPWRNLFGLAGEG